MILKRIIPTALLFVSTALSANSIPVWVMEPPKGCALAIGSGKSADPKSEAMIFSAMEHGMMESTTVSSMFTLIKNEKIKRKSFEQIIKLTGRTYSGGLKVQSDWHNKQGDYFVLTCKDASQALNSFPFRIISFNKLAKFEGESSNENLFEVTIADKKMVETITSDGAKGIEDRANTPDWVFTSAYVGSANVVNNDLGAAYLEAMANARNHIAQLEEVKVTQMVTTTKPKENDTATTEEEDVNQQVVDQTIQGSYLKKFWWDKQSQHVFVSLEIEPAETKGKDEAALLWEQFKKEKKE